MSPKMKTMITFALVAVVGAGVAGGALWWLYLSKPAVAGAAPVAEKAPASKKSHKYLTLEKVIVMLRRNPGEGGTPHYLSTDLVISTSEETEKHAKEHLPLLRSIAVASLSDYSLEKASEMTVAQLAEHLNHAFNEHYEREKVEKPFTEALIGKLIID